MATTSIADKLAKLEKKIAKREKTIAVETKELDSEINGGSLKSEALKTTKKLRTWVNNMPLYLQLQWFDTVEQVEISTKLRSRRWNTEVTSCDALYLEKIGLYQEC